MNKICLLSEISGFTIGPYQMYLLSSTLVHDRACTSCIHHNNRFNEMSIECKYGVNIQMRTQWHGISNSSEEAWWLWYDCKWKFSSVFCVLGLIVLVPF